jgi:hypothetical protein
VALAPAGLLRCGSDHDGPQQAAAVAIGSWISELAGRFAAAGLAGAEPAVGSSVPLVLTSGSQGL